MAEIQIPEREIVPIESLKVDGLNPNRMTARQIDALKEDIKKYGFIVDIITNKDGLIADGQNRWEAAKELGMTMVPIRRLPLTEVDRRILRQVLNKLHGSHDWDADINEYGFIKDEGRFEELKALLGGGDPHLERFLEMLSSESKDINALPDAKQNKHGVEFGQVWALGDHRLICGDSLKQETYEKLLQGEKADFIFTDPPYNVDYDYTKVGLGPTGSKKYHSKGKLFNDKLSDTEFESFLETCFKNALAFSQGNMAVYCCSASRTAIQFRDALLRAGLSYRQTIVWIKERFIFALGEDFHRCYEPILYLTKGKPYVDKKLCTESDVWGLNYIDFADQLDAWYNERDKAVEYVHPTQKPVGLVCRALRKSSKEGWIVLDMFGGSGTTLMACEQMKRKARLIELDAFYCSAIIERWQSFTGKKAFKL